MTARKNQTIQPRFHTVATDVDHSRPLTSETLATTRDMLARVVLGHLPLRAA
jgi:hypothetical protein